MHMNGSSRNSSMPANLVQAPNTMLAITNPAFIQNSPHLAQPPIPVPQNIAPSNPPMGMLSGGPPPNPNQRYPLSSNPMPQHQPPQQRPMLLRQAPNGPQLNNSAAPSAAHMQAQLQGMQFPGQQGPPGGPANIVRRVQSQPQMNPLGGMPNNVGGGMNIQMGLSPHLRQAQAAAQQHQLRFHQQQQALMHADAMRNQGPTQAMPPNMARTPSAQNQVMNSLGAQPSSLASVPHPTAIQPPHQNHPFPNGGPIPSQHPQLSSSPGPPQTHTPSLSMATPGPSHTPVNRPRMTPDNSNVSFMGYPGTQFPANNPPRVPSSSNPAGYPFVPSSSTPTPMHMDVAQSSPSSLHSQGGTPNRSSFVATPAQPFDLMNNNQGMDIYPPSFNMGPPTTVPPPRPPSHANNPHQPQPNPQQQSSLQQSQQSQQQQPHHQSPPQSDQMHPQRPQSQPQQLIPGRPPSQAGTTRTPRSMQIPLPSTALAGSGSLTATGRISNAQQTTGPPSMMPPITSRPPLAIGGVPPPPSAVSQMSVDAPQSGVPQPIQRPPIAPPPSNIIPGQGIVRLLQFSGVLSSETKTKFQLSWWSDLVKEYFTPRADLRLTLWKDNARNEAKPFQIGVPIMPRFFLVTTQSGVKSMSFTLDGARERPYQQGQPQTGHTMIECVSAVWTFRYTNGYTVHLRGPLTAHVVITASTPPGNSQVPQYALKFDELQFDANMHDKYIALDSILGSRSIETPKLNNISTPSSGTSSQAQQQIDEDKRWEEPRLLISRGSIPGEPVNAFGIPQATMRCLELAESVSSMGDLIAFSNETKLGPIDALKQFANKIREQSAASGQHPPFMNNLPLNLNNNSSHTSLSNTFPSYLPPMGQSVTLYSSAPSSITNPPNLSSSMNSPQNTSSSSANSPEKQLKTIPQQQQQQLAPTPSQSGPASSPAVSSSGTTNNTPALANATPKRKLGDASSPATATTEQQPTKRNPRKRGRTGTTSGPG